MTGLPAEQIQRARETDILEVASRYVTLRRVSKFALQFVVPCPICRDGVDRFAIDVRKGLWSCRHCDGGKHGKIAGGNVVDLMMRVEGVGFAEAVERLSGSTINARQRASTDGEVILASAVVKAAPERPVRDDWAKRDLASAARIVAGIVPLIGTPGEVNLRDVRKIDVREIQDVLSRTDAIGWHPSVYFNSPEYPRPRDPPHPLHGQRLGAIIGNMTDPVTAKPTGAISRTYLAPDGTKVLKAKTLGSPRGIIRLSPDDEVLGGLHVAEGIETALTGMANFGLRPMWATGDCGLMASFPVLSGIEAITVIADHDQGGKGKKAACELEARWLAAGRRREDVKLLLRDRLGDLNDALRALL